MGKSFKKFKSKARMQALLSSLLLGIGAGASVCAVLMLVRKLSGAEPLPVYYLIGAGTALVLATALYFIFTPSNKRLARRLDTLYGLNEKVITMVEFDGDDGAFYRLQREDAEEKLSQKPMKAMKSRALLTGIISFVISIGLIVGAVAVPVRADSEDPIDEFDKQWILTSLDELIVMVRNSYVADKLKDSYIADLEALSLFVQENQYFSEMKAEAIKTVGSIDLALEAVNTASSIGERFATSQDQGLLELGNQLKALSGNGSKKALEAYADALLDADYSAIEFSASEINSYLSYSGAAIDDSLYILFKTLAAEMQNGSKTDIEKAFEDAGKQISNEIIIQNVNASTTSTVVATLCELFGITQSDLDGEGMDVIIPDGDHDVVGPGDAGGEDNDDRDEPIGSGGIGTGDVIYAGDDLIYDPAKNTYVPYGDLLNEYFAKVNEQITDGKISEETAKLIEEYFGCLFGNYENDSN